MELVGCEDIEAGSPSSFSSWVVHITLRELQIIKDACNVTKFESIRDIWDTKNPPYTREDKNKLQVNTSAILESYR